MKVQVNVRVVSCNYYYCCCIYCTSVLLNISTVYTYLYIISLFVPEVYFLRNQQRYIAKYRVSPK